MNHDIPVFTSRNHFTDAPQSQGQKKNSVFDLYTKLMGALIGLVRACTTNQKTQRTDYLLMEGLNLAANANAVPGSDLREMIAKLGEEKAFIAPGCAVCTQKCGNTDDYDMTLLFEEKDRIRCLKSILLSQVMEIGTFAWHALEQRRVNPETVDYLHRALFALSQEWEEEWLQPVVEEGAREFLCCLKFSCESGYNGDRE